MKDNTVSKKETFRAPDLDEALDLWQRSIYFLAFSMATTSNPSNSS